MVAFHLGVGEKNAILQYRISDSTQEEFTPTFQQPIGSQFIFKFRV